MKTTNIRKTTTSQKLKICKNKGFCDHIPDFFMKSLDVKLNKK